MPTINITTKISAPIERVFDLARSIDLHSISTKNTQERAIAGRTSGLIELNETVTWEAYHFGVKQKLTSKITALEHPYYFRDEMIKGAFKKIYHEHIFSEQNNITVMVDKFNYDTPFGILGSLFNQLILHRYMHKFLTERNQIIKEYAETKLWENILIKQ